MAGGKGIVYLVTTVMDQHHVSSSTSQNKSQMNKLSHTLMPCRHRSCPGPARLYHRQSIVGSRPWTRGEWVCECESCFAFESAITRKDAIAKWYTMSDFSLPILTEKEIQVWPLLVNSRKIVGIESNAYMQNHTTITKPVVRVVCQHRQTPDTKKQLVLRKTSSSLTWKMPCQKSSDVKGFVYGCCWTHFL